jgi:hypothetical protein
LIDVWRWKKNERTPTIHIDCSYVDTYSIYEERRPIMWTIIVHSFQILLGFVALAFIVAVGCIVIISLDADIRRTMR